jgi:hypothetical protein
MFAVPILLRVFFGLSLFVLAIVGTVQHMAAWQQKAVDPMPAAIAVVCFLASMYFMATGTEPRLWEPLWKDRPQPDEPTVVLPHYDDSVRRQ